MALYFNESLHRYTDNNDLPYISQTQVIDLYCAAKDWIGIAEACEAIGKNEEYADPTHYKYEKYLKYKGKTAEMLLAEWNVIKKEALDKGNRKHNFLETIIKSATNFLQLPSSSGKVKLFTVEDMIADRKSKFNIDKVKLEDLKKRYPKIYNVILHFIKDGWRVYSEIGVFNNEFRVAGLIDLLLYKHPYFFIIDWKTNKAPIKFEAGYWASDRDGDLVDEYILTGETFLPPIDYVESSVGNKYTLQLSGYTYMTECFGLEPVNKNLLFQIREEVVKDDENKKIKIDGRGVYNEVLDPHTIKYLKKPIIDMFIDYRKRIINNQEYVVSSN